MTKLHATAGEPQGLSHGVVWMLTVMCGVSIASAYYAQPLLPIIGRSLGVSDAAMGLLPMLTQLGIGSGVLLLMPMGDIVDGRKLILVLVGAHAVALAAVGSSSSATMLNAASLGLGLTLVTPYLLPAFAARLTPGSNRGQVTGKLAGGVFAGILLARTASGYLGYFFGWPSIYWFALCAVLVMGALFAWKIPAIPSGSPLSYLQLMSSLPDILRRHRSLQVAALTQGLLFGGFNVFWISLAFYLETPQFQLPSYVAGLFGVIGLAGVLAAPGFGRLTDRRGAAFALRLGTAVTLAAWLALALFGGHLSGLIAGVVLLDLGTTACHIANQTTVYQLGDDIRSRVATLYILGLFIGASILSPLAALAWSHGGWTAVCLLGGSASLLAVIVNRPSFGRSNVHPVPKAGDAAPLRLEERVER
jgi:predicted MFS family arabinose efflux permease